MGGRAFAVNYRLAPQYPFPCALADCLAAYLYLIRPPENAKLRITRPKSYHHTQFNIITHTFSLLVYHPIRHRMIDPSKIVIAGDSAGGGLSLALLTLIRDVGLPMPAGAVLISPWVDLTHSFPSIMTNSDKDIIRECLAIRGLQ
jgi:acetyl esterase/lipase